MQSWMCWKPERSNRKIFLVFYPENGRSESFESLALLEEHILVVSQKGMLRYLQWTESNRSLLIKWFAQHSCIIHMFHVLLRKIISFPEMIYSILLLWTLANEGWTLPVWKFFKCSYKQKNILFDCFMQVETTGRKSYT